MVELTSPRVGQDMNALSQPTSNPESREPKPKVETLTNDASDAKLMASQKHLILIADDKDRARAVAAFRQIQIARVTLPGNVMAVSGEHVRALMNEQIPFSFVSRDPNESAPPRQS